MSAALPHSAHPTRAPYRPVAGGSHPSAPALREGRWAYLVRPYLAVWVNASAVADSITEWWIINALRLDAGRWSIALPQSAVTACSA
jgi:hypothetical protein